MKRSSALFLALVLASSLMAQGPGPGTAAPGGPGAAAPPLAGQGSFRKDLRLLNLSQSDYQAIGAILDKKAEALATAQSEMKIVQARLERLLLDKDPDLEAIRQLVKSSLEWELQMRMIKIERAIELRKFLGNERWAILQRLSREYLLAKRTDKLRPGDLGENAEALIGLLERLE